MIRQPSPRQWRVFVAQMVLGTAGLAAAIALLPSWWALLPLPLGLVLPALYGAAMDTWDERRAARAQNQRWAVKMHPSTWDEYFSLPERKWDE